MSTPVHAMPEIAQNQANKYVTHNESLRHIDGKMQLSIEDKDLVTSPAVISSDDGKVWIVAGTGGDWATFSVDDLAHYYDGVWYNYVPSEGWIGWINDENSLYYFDGANWTIFVGSLNPEFITLKAGDVAGGNYFEVESDGTFELIGNAKVWKDENFSGNPGSGSSSPSIVNWDATNLETYGFDGGATTEELFSGKELQHDYAEGTDLKFHIHWSPIDTNAGNVKWQMEIVILGDGATKYSSSISAIQAAGGTAYTPQYLAIETVDGSDFEIGDQVGIRLFRDPSDGADTYGSDALLAFTYGFHYEVDTLGSRTEIAK